MADQFRPWDSRFDRHRHPSELVPVLSPPSRRGVAGLVVAALVGAVAGVAFTAWRDR